MAVTIIVRLTEREADEVLRCELRQVDDLGVSRQTIAQKTAQMKLYSAVFIERMDAAS